MYTVDALDEVISLEGLPLSDVGAPSPLVLADELTAVVAYVVRHGQEPAVEALTDGPPEDGEPMAVLSFAGQSAHMFGPPNDEALDSHPLARRGLQPYGSFCVKQSSWIRALERMSAVHLRHRREAFATRQHFILTFHDSTFECVACEVHVFPRYVRASGVMQRMLDALKQSPGSSERLG